MEHPFIPYTPSIISTEESLAQAKATFERVDQRRSVRHFDTTPVPKSTIEYILKSASTAPSGAHKQPWTFCAVSNPSLKKQIREAAEKEEQANYAQRMSDEWKADLAPLGTDDVKPFLEDAPWLIVVFKQSYGLDAEGKRKLHYYVNESVGIATGFLLEAIHEAGLASLTHTPSPMNFLEKLLNRPANEKAYMLIPVGFPKAECMVPDIQRKELGEVAEFFE
jgi:iodotyrosine deiodinase